VIRPSLALAISVGFGIVAQEKAASDAFARAHYSKYEYAIPDAGRYPATIGPSDLFMKDNVIVAYQDVRGRCMLEGEWMEVRPLSAGTVPMTDESTDAWDTIDWIVKHVASTTPRRCRRA
jgi:predicted acyl esterase